MRIPEMRVPANSRPVIHSRPVQFGGFWDNVKKEVKDLLDEQQKPYPRSDEPGISEQAKRDRKLRETIQGLRDITMGPNGEFKKEKLGGTPGLIANA